MVLVKTGAQIPENPARFARRNVEFPKDFQWIWSKLVPEPMEPARWLGARPAAAPGRRQGPEIENLFFGTYYFFLLSAARSRRDPPTHPEPPSPDPTPKASQRRLVNAERRYLNAERS